MSDTSKTVFLKFHQTSIGNSKKVATSAVEVEADKTLIKVSKVLLDSKELEAIRSFDGSVRAWLDSRCLPFEAGIRLLPVALIEEVDAKLEEFSQQREDLVEAFVAVYDDLKADARRRLNGLFDPRNYPSADKVRAKFSMSHQYLSFDTPAALGEINSAVFSRERAKLQQRMEDAYQEAREVLRETCRDLVGHLRERLEPGADGTRKRLAETTLEKLREFLDNFTARNITDDAELGRYVEQARSLLAGRYADTLREGTDYFRAGMRRDLEAIETAIDDTLIQPSRRRLALNGLEAA